MMKKLITFLTIVLFSIFTISAQKARESKEKIKALKVAFLTEKLNLTTEEAEKFWPIYNVFDEEQRSLRNNTRKAMRAAVDRKGDLKEISEAEAEKLITSKLENDKKIYDSQFRFITKIKKVLPFKKIIKLQVAEVDFSRKLMRKYRRKHSESKE